MFTDSATYEFTIDTRPTYQLSAPVASVAGSSILIGRDERCTQVSVYLRSGTSGDFTFIKSGNYSSIDILDIDNLEPINTFRVVSVGDRVESINGMPTRILSSTTDFTYNRPDYALATPTGFSVAPNSININWVACVNVEYMQVFVRRANSTAFEYITTTDAWYASIQSLNLTVGNNTVRVISQGTGFNLIDGNLVNFINSNYGDFNINVEGTRTQQLGVPHSFVRLNDEFIWQIDPFSTDVEVCINRHDGHGFVPTGSNIPTEIYLVELALTAGNNTMRVVATSDRVALINGYLITFTNSPAYLLELLVTNVQSRPLNAPYDVVLTQIVFGVERMLVWRYEGSADESHLEIKRAGSTNFVHVETRQATINVDMLALTRGENIIRIRSLGTFEELVDGVLYRLTCSPFTYIVLYKDANNNVLLRQ